MSFIHFNARCLIANLKKIRDFLAELDLQFDFIAISETCAELDLISDYNINNYNGYHITRGDRRGGGVAIYKSKELSCKLLETKSMTIEHIFECFQWKYP